MTRIFRWALPAVAALSFVFCTPAAAGLVASDKPAAAAEDLSGASMSRSIAPELLAAAHDLQHAGVHVVVIITAGVVLIVVGIILLVHYLDDHHTEIEIDDDDDIEIEREPGSP